MQNTLCLAFTPLPLLKPKQLHQKSDQEVCLSTKHAEHITQRKRMHQFCSTPFCHLIPCWPNPLTKTCIVANLAVFIFHLQGKEKKKKKAKTADRQKITQLFYKMKHGYTLFWHHRPSLHVELTPLYKNHLLPLGADASGQRLPRRTMGGEPHFKWE